MNFDLNAGGELPAGPPEEGRRLEAQHMPKHFSPKFPNDTELKLGAEIRSGRLRERSDKAEQDQKPDDLGHGKGGERKRARRRLRRQITL
jgi:hypothetical protein